MKSRHSRCFRPILALTFGLAVTTGVGRVEAEPKAQPLRVKSEDLQSVTFARLVLRLPGTTEISIAGDSYRVLFLEELRKNGYPALGAESVVFEQDESSKARYVLGATVLDLMCAPTGLMNGRRCRIGVLWELMDRANDRVAYRTMTRHITTGDQAESIGNELVWGSFFSLLSRQKFVDALKKREPDRSENPAHPAARFRRCDGGKLSMPGDAEKVLASTVVVETPDGLGSGVVISPDGLVLTAEHVVSHPGTIKVRFRGGRELTAARVRMNKRDDVALVRVESSEPLACLAVRSDDVRIGEELYAIGSPLGKTLSFSLTRGILSGVRDIDGVSLLQTDASVNRGNSGGPMVDQQGRWAAITTWKAAGRNVEGIAFGVPVATTFHGLGLEQGDTTDAVLTRPEAASEVVPVAAGIIDDPPDPLLPLFPERIPEPEKPKAPRTAVSRTVETAGWIGAVAGLAGVIGSYGYYKSSEDSIKPDGFDRARLANDISWGVLFAGLATVGVAYGLPREKVAATSPAPHKPAPGNVAWSANVGLGSISLQVRY